MNVKEVEGGAPRGGAKIDLALDDVVKSGVCAGQNRSSLAIARSASSRPRSNTGVIPAAVAILCFCVVCVRVCVVVCVCVCCQQMCVHSHQVVRVMQGENSGKV